MRPSERLRSFLFVPGNHAARLAKALAAGADAVIFDLEDAVPHSEKGAARTCVAGALARPRSCRAYVRVNGIASGLAESDLRATLGRSLDGVMLPKVQSVEDVRALADLVERLERERRLTLGAIDFIALIESARALHRLDDIAAASPRLSRLAFGGVDYTHDLGLQWTVEEGELAHARARLTHVSRVAGLEPPIDTALLQIKDLARFGASARRARSMGFTAKLCIHPDQVAPCNDSFTPGAAEVEHARKVIAAFEKAEAAGSASIQLDGQFIDYAVVSEARKVLALRGR